MTARLTISLPNDLVAALDRQIIRDGESRSAAIRRLIETAIRHEHEQAEIDRYIRGYEQAPQTEDEFGWLDSVAPEAMSELPWE
jgi:metal-responsive CopG/Arc/MetJ family transcriptional regulator